MRGDFGADGGYGERGAVGTYRLGRQNTGGYRVTCRHCRGGRRSTPAHELQKLRDHRPVRASVTPLSVGHHLGVIRFPGATLAMRPHADTRTRFVAEILHPAVGTDNGVVPPVVRGEVTLRV